MKQLIASALVLMATYVVAAAPPPALSPAAATSLSSFLRGATERGAVPGVVALVVGRDGILYHEAFGKLSVARNTPMPKDAIFRIASMTKPMTSAAVMMLIEEGKLRLDDEAAKYVPSLASPKVITRVDEASRSYDTRPAQRPITIRHLLTHTSGIGYAWSDPRLALVQRTGVAEADLPLVAEPGERWTYGSSTKILGDIVEKVTGQRIDAFLQARLIGPLGMTDTAFDVAADKRARVPPVYQRMDGALAERPNPDSFAAPVRGDGGLYATAADYAQFVRMLLNDGQANGRRLLAARSVRDMTRNQIGALVVPQQPSATPALSKPFPLGAGVDKWGLGFQIAARSNDPAARSAGSYAWAGIDNTHFWVDPQRGIGVILLMQVLPFYDEQCIELLTGVERRVNQGVS